MTFSSQALAASSEWANNEGGRMRLVLLGDDGTGQRHGALVIEPKPGWMTYWREPGDVGIPPALTPVAPEGLRLERVDFPVPVLLDEPPLTDIGYTGAVTLPLRFSGVPSFGTIRLDAFIGLCRDICIPFEAQLQVDANGAIDPQEEALVAAARRALPKPPSPDFTVLDQQLTQTPHAMTLRLKLPKGHQLTHVFASRPGGSVFVEGQARMAGAGEIVYTMPLGKAAKKREASSENWNLLVITNQGAMETTLAFD